MSQSRELEIQHLPFFLKQNLNTQEIITKFVLTNYYFQGPRSFFLNIKLMQQCCIHITHVADM